MPGNPAIAFLMFLAFCTPVVQAQTQVPVRTLLDGVYSDAQATRGLASYTAACSLCHGKALDGVSAPELTGNRFIERWREGRLDGIYNYIRENMPRVRTPDAQPIPASDYLDILTYILSVNGYRAGPSELTPDLLGDILFVGKNGPRPVPDGSLVITTGCLSQGRDGVWLLSSATEPARTRTETTSTPAELSASSAQRLGTLVFRLADLEAVPDFEPAVHIGHKMQAKGYLVRQPNAERISLSAMDMLYLTCAP